MILYIGSYTTAENPKGLAVVDFDGSTGKMKLVEKIAADNPLYFAKSSDGRILYANEADGLSSFAIGADGKLSRIDSVRYGAKAMCHVAVMPGDEVITWAAYTSGEAGDERVKDGRFLGGVRHRHVGHGPDPRQSTAHCHAAVPTPDGRHYAVVDLGLDAIVTYEIGSEGEGEAYKTAPAGAGPRHLLYHPDGRHAFAVFELGSRLAMYEWSERDGFKLLDSCSTLPEAFRGLNQDAAIRFTSDGRRVVVSNRGYDSLTVFDYDFASGKLQFRNRTVLPGSWPRDFIFIPGTDFAVVTMERSGTLLAVRYDESTGTFTPVDTLHGFHRPVAVTAIASANFR